MFSFGLTWNAYNWLLAAGTLKTFYIIASIQAGICLFSIPMCRFPTTMQLVWIVLILSNRYLRKEKQVILPPTRSVEIDRSRFTVWVQQEQGVLNIAYSRSASGWCSELDLIWGMAMGYGLSASGCSLQSSTCYLPCYILIWHRSGQLQIDLTLSSFLCRPCSTKQALHQS